MTIKEINDKIFELENELLAFRENIKFSRTYKSEKTLQKELKNQQKYLESFVKSIKKPTLEALFHEIIDVRGGEMEQSEKTETTKTTYLESGTLRTKINIKSISCGFKIKEPPFNIIKDIGDYTSRTGNCPGIKNYIELGYKEERFVLALREVAMITKTDEIEVNLVKEKSSQKIYQHK